MVDLPSASPPAQPDPSPASPPTATVAPARLPLPRPAGGAAALVLIVLLLAPRPLPRAVADDFRAAQAAAARQEYAAAADALSDAAARLPYDSSVIYRAGLADISAKRFESAIARLKAAGALDGLTPAMRTALGDAYTGLGDRAAALAQWELALKDLPTDDGLLVRLANTYEAEGRYPDAISMLNALAQLRASDPAVHYRLALLTAATAPADALSRLTLVVDLAPDLAPNAKALLRAITGGQASGDQAYTFGQVGFTFVQLNEWGLAELALTRAVGLNPQYADAYAYLGLALDKQNKDGRAAYKTALQLAPDSALVKFFLGLHWRRRGEPGTALTYLKDAQKLDPKNPAIAAEIGGAYESLGDLLNAEIWYTEAVRQNPQDPNFWLLLARFYVDNNYHMADLGLPAARQAVSLNPDSALAADALGYALVLTDDPVNGEKTLERAAALDPNLPSAYYHLGLLYAQQGKTREAEAALKHTLALDPQGAYGNLALKALARLSP